MASHPAQDKPTQFFLESLFESKPDDTCILIWTLPQKVSHWCKSVNDAVKIVGAQAQKDRTNVYVGVGLVPTSYPAAKAKTLGVNQKEIRCDAKDIAGIVGLWADLDIQDPAHKKPNLPPDERAVSGLLESMGLLPTLVLHSGHGIQAWWLFKEPWVFTSNQDRKSAADLSARWTGTLRARAKDKGWDVDATHDLSRVLRVPGTTNHKSAPVPVRILQTADIRYSPEDFDAFLLDGIQGVNERSEQWKGISFTLDPNAQPDFDKFDLLKEMNPKFLLSWEHKRKDFQDQSGSVYDLSLASMAAEVGWADQDIVNLLISHRRKYGEDLKLRQDYYGRTVAKARETHAKKLAQEAIDEFSVTGGDQTIPVETRRQSIIGYLSELFNVELRRIVKYLSDPPAYKLETDFGNIVLGDVINLINQTQLRNKVAAATGRYIPKFKAERWDAMAQSLLDCCVPEELGKDATDAGLAEGWVVLYLEQRKIMDSKSEAAETLQPYREEGSTYIFGTDFRRWVTVTQGERHSAKSIGTLLRAYGAVPVTVAVKVEKQFTTRGAWRLPLKAEAG